MTTQTTTITPPRVPLIDERTGLISREWYRFILNLFVLTGSGTTTTTVLNVHETENLNLATQAFSPHSIQPTVQPIDSDQSIINVSSFLPKQAFHIDYAIDQDVLSKESLLRHPSNSQIDFGYSQQILASRIFGCGG